jgi:hypothetical protein
MASHPSQKREGWGTQLLVALKNHYGFAPVLPERFSAFQSFSVWSA